MNKIIFLLVAFMFTNMAFAFDVPKNEEYYKSQIQNQRFLYNTAGVVNAINKNNIQVVDYFMKAGFNPNSTFTGTSLLTYAINSKKPECVHILLEAGAKPETKDLFQAIYQKSSFIVDDLIEHNVDINKKHCGMLPINWAIRSKQVKIVESLLKAGATPDKETQRLIKKSKDEYLKDLFSGIEEQHEN